MIKGIVVAGCRNYENYKEAKEFIGFCIGRITKEYTLIFLSGGCRGADKLGERYAAEYGYKIEFYPAQWENTEPTPGRSETGKWLSLAIMLSAFGMGKAGEQDL